MAKGFIKQARSSLEAARQAAREGHWAYAVRTSQEASELALKALLLTSGTEPPKVHDLGETLRQRHKSLAGLGLTREEVEEMARMAEDLARERSEALYGDEHRKVPAFKMYERPEAEQALSAADRIHERCREVVERHLL